MKLRFLAGAILLLAAGTGAFFLFGHPRTTASPTYEFTKVSRSSLEKVVSSSGKLEAVSTVSVLPQMSGRVEKVLVTYNDRVRQGQVLAELNTDMLQLQAEVQRAAVRKAQATYDLQKIDYDEKKILASHAAVSDYDVKTSQTNLEIDAADLAAAQASLKVIETQIHQYASITSPIDATVLASNVSVGQSVVEGSSTNSTSLFTLAADLKNLQIKASVDELDIGSIVTGQSVRFTVEALPGTKFTGKVQEIRLVPETTDNVVNYSVIVAVDNTDNKLLPGMTADVEFIKESRSDVLVVPTAALRYQPSSLTEAQIQQKVAVAEGTGPGPQPTGSSTKAQGLTGLIGGMGAGGPPGGGPPGGGGPGGPPGSKTTTAKTKTTSSEVVRKTLWYVDDQGALQVLSVETGISNSTSTEILKPALDGRTVILKERTGS